MYLMRAIVMQQVDEVYAGGKVGGIYLVLTGGEPAGGYYSAGNIIEGVCGRRF